MQIFCSSDLKMHFFFCSNTGDDQLNPINKLVVVNTDSHLNWTQFNHTKAHAPIHFCNAFCAWNECRFVNNVTWPCLTADKFDQLGFDLCSQSRITPAHFWNDFWGPRQHSNSKPVVWHRKFFFPLSIKVVKIPYLQRAYFQTSN